MTDVPTATRKTVKILAVEDSPTQLGQLRFVLEGEGFSVVTAANGREGLAAAGANEIDLVISDIVMPEMDGYALCKALRADPRLRRLPVILLTSLADPQDVIRGLEAGANNFICKPYEDRALLARVQNVLANQEIRRTAFSEMGISIFFAGQPFFITADRLQILDLLLSTYENAVSQNAELTRARDDLRVFNERLEAKVAERTATLTAEVEKRERLTAAIEQAAEMMIVTDPRGDIVYVNPAFEAVTGYSRAEVLGRNPRFLKSGEHDKAFYRTLWETISGGKIWRGRMINRKKDGTLFTQEASISPVRDSAGAVTSYVAMQQDMTHELALEEQFYRSQKMEAIGSLAGGVAHDFNNILMAQIGYCELMKRGLKDEDPLAHGLAQIKACAERAATLTRQLLAFSRKQTLQPEVLDLNAAVESIEQMLKRVLGEDIEFATAPAPDLGRVRADPGQIDQVIMNLVVNARDAMPQGGTLTLETANIELDGDYERSHVGAHAGPHVMLAITDTGCGMDEKTQSRLFEPFFTTKEQGKGTGLGLATVYGIVRQSEGTIWVYSEPGKGATFKVYLPRVNDDLTTHAERKAPAAQGRGELILVAEDEPVLRELFTLMLEHLGYRVQVAANGGEALLAVEEKGLRPDLLITDVVMPGMSGRELAERLVRTQPGLKVLYTSGYTADSIVHHGVLDHEMPFLQKPFSIADLGAKVQELLHAGERLEQDVPTAVM